MSNAEDNSPNQKLIRAGLAIGQMFDMQEATTLKRHYSKRTAEYVITLLEGHPPESKCARIKYAAFPVVHEDTPLVTIERVGSARISGQKVMDLSRKQITPKSYTELDYNHKEGRPPDNLLYHSTDLHPSYDQLRDSGRKIFNLLGMVDTGGHLLSPFYRLQWGGLLPFGAGIPEGWKREVGIDAATVPLAAPVVLPPVQGERSEAAETSKPRPQGGAPSSLPERRGYLAYVYEGIAASYGKLLDVPSALFAQISRCPTGLGGVVHQFKVFSASRCAVYTSFCSQREDTWPTESRLLKVNLYKETANSHWAGPNGYKGETGTYRPGRGFIKTGTGFQKDPVMVQNMMLSAHGHLNGIIKPPPLAP